ncbi:hypothetical protein IQ255_31070 [Pleurocapsales cyanobacterium LEGE 10410]|nr:hypothetical protein [Pleurocapsales cyanobacterium LEGE 10410]
MRYSIMLQVVGIITLIFVGTAGLFAWLQNRESLTESTNGHPRQLLQVGETAQRTVSQLIIDN